MTSASKFNIAQKDSLLGKFIFRQEQNCSHYNNCIEIWWEHMHHRVVSPGANDN